MPPRRSAPRSGEARALAISRTNSVPCFVSCARPGCQPFRFSGPRCRSGYRRSSVGSPLGTAGGTVCRRSRAEGSVSALRNSTTSSTSVGAQGRAGVLERVRGEGRLRAGAAHQEPQASLPVPDGAAAQRGAHRAVWARRRDHHAPGLGGPLQPVLRQAPGLRPLPAGAAAPGHAPADGGQHLQDPRPTAAQPRPHTTRGCFDQAPGNTSPCARQRRGTLAGSNSIP